MSSIRKSLIKLDHVVAKLESSTAGLESTIAGQQRDMFAAPPPSASNDDGIEGSIVVQALDQTISRVEKLLAGA